MFVYLQKARPSGETLMELFTRHAGTDGVVDARELRGLLNEAFAQGKESEEQCLLMLNTFWL